jgi:hypothetical protein
LAYSKGGLNLALSYDGEVWSVRRPGHGFDIEGEPYAYL